MNRPKIIAIVPSSYVGGTEIVTIDVLDYLKNRNVQLFCVTNAWTDGEVEARLKQMGIGFRPLKLGWIYIRKLTWTFDSIIHFPKAFVSFLRIYKEFQPNLIYLTSYRPIIILWPVLSCKIIYHVHESNFYSRVSRLCIRMTDRKVKRYIAVSEFIKSDLISCGIDPAKVEVIHNGVDLPDSARSVVNKINVNFAIIGQLIESKGHEDLLEATRILVKQGISNFQVKIFGKGSSEFVFKLEKTISRYEISDKIEWMGYKRNTDDIYRNVDVVVAPTRMKEPFGMMAAEANARGIPVVASNQGGLVEIIQDGYNGFLVNPFSPAELAEKMKLFIDDIRLIDKMRVNCKQRVKEFFLKSKSLKETESLIKETLCKQ